jgi:hypothetical protein
MVDLGSLRVRDRRGSGAGYRPFNPIQTTVEIAECDFIITDFLTIVNGLSITDRTNVTVRLLVRREDVLFFCGYCKSALFV